jgi:ligand-binding sensor domain-containing protein
MPSNYISCLEVDKNNIKWLGTLDKGLAGFDGKNWKTYSKNNSPLIYDFITSLAVDKYNTLWIGTSGGLMSFNGSTWINYSGNLPSTYVTSLAFDASGNMWIGTQNGLVKYDGSTWSILNTGNSGIAANFVTSLAVDPANKIWIGSNSYGISMYDGVNWKIYNMSNMGLAVKVGNSIQKVAADKEGNIWAAHIQNTITGDVGGLTMFNGTTWSVVSISGLPTETTQSIYVDENNYKWIGTKGGMAKFKYPSDITLFTTINSKLPASQVQGVLIDMIGDLWVGTFGGGAGKLKKGGF